MSNFFEKPKSKIVPTTLTFPKVEGSKYRSKEEGRHFAHLWLSCELLAILAAAAAAILLNVHKTPTSPKLNTIRGRA
jgi:hypothetical protein